MVLNRYDFARLIGGQHMKYQDIFWNAFLLSGDPEAYVQYKEHSNKKRDNAADTKLNTRRP